MRATVYHISPIDLWGLAIPVSSLSGPRRTWADGLVEIAMHDVAMNDVGWEGDVREGPYIIPVLAEVEVLHAVAWKQDNNGNTFIWSPVPLPHLDSVAFGKSRGLLRDPQVATAPQI